MADRIPFAGLSRNLMPVVMQYARERRTEQRRLQGQADISQAMTTFFQDQDVSPDERTAALAKMITGGAPVTGAMMQSLQAEQDLDPFFKKLGIGKDDPARVLWNMGALSRQQLGADLLRSMRAEQEEEEFDESLQTLFDAGLVKLDGIERGIGADGEIRSEVEQLKAIAAYKEKYGEKAAGFVMAQAGLLGDDKQWQGVLSQIDEGMPLEEMSAADRALIVDKVKSPANRAALFAEKGDAAKIFTTGINVINRKAQAFFPIFGLGEALNKWATGQPSPFLNPTSIAFLEKHFEKTGEHKYDAVVEEGYKAFQHIESLADRMNLTPSEKKDVQSLFKYMTSSNFRLEDIDWDKVQATLQIRSIKPENLKSWYESLLNATK